MLAEDRLVVTVPNFDSLLGVVVINLLVVGFCLEFVGFMGCVGGNEDCACGFLGLDGFEGSSGLLETFGVIDFIFFSTGALLFGGLTEAFLSERICLPGCCLLFAEVETLLLAFP